MKHHKLEAWANARAIAKDRHEMAAILNVLPDSVSSMLSYYGLPRFEPARVHSEDTRRKIISLYESGASLRDVAHEVQLSPGKVAGILSRAGVMGSRLTEIRVKAAIKRTHKRPTAKRKHDLIEPKFRRSPFKAKADPVTPLHVSLEDREQFMCAFPYGDGPFSFCGHPKQQGFSYCPDHCAIVYRAPEARERAPRPR